MNYKKYSFIGIGGICFLSIIAVISYFTGVNEKFAGANPTFVGTPINTNATTTIENILTLGAGTTTLIHPSSDVRTFDNSVPDIFALEIQYTASTSENIPTTIRIGGVKTNFPIRRLLGVNLTILPQRRLIAGQ